MAGTRDDEDKSPEVSSPVRGGAFDAPAAEAGGDASPRAARFGEGVEGRGGRRERAVAGPRQGFFGRAGQFIHDVRAELKRVTWPTATEVKNTTIITIIAVIFFAFYLWGVDKLFTFLITQLGRFFAWLF